MSLAGVYAGAYKHSQRLIVRSTQSIELTDKIGWIFASSNKRLEISNVII